MSSASDIANLFEVADASPSQYREVERAEQTQGLRGRWSTLDAAEPDLVAPAPVASAQADAADPADLPVTADALDAPVTTEASPDAVCAMPAAASEPLPAEQAALEEPVVQPTPEPVVAVQQSAALSSVFARLMERNEPRGDVAQRGAP
ncbi:BcsR/BcsP family cellulose biosynthesis protein [Paraburkholderia nodosa]|uniref:BcsR/BcsP family cellulose biosynthesis protein n=1 Tax=Paraburkholderia nodosa TaxID=392320 RepID=UPI000487E96C|nr:BcsR/BcsP family cellulose biosynthesis protein [Paraburkholderia nodosa]